MPNPFQITLDLSCVSENKYVYRDQDYVRLAKKCTEQEKLIKELEDKIRLFNSLSRKKKK